MLGQLEQRRSPGWLGEVARQSQGVCRGGHWMESVDSGWPRVSRVPATQNLQWHGSGVGRASACFSSADPCLPSSCFGLIPPSMW